MNSIYTRFFLPVVGIIVLILLLSYVLGYQIVQDYVAKEADAAYQQRTIPSLFMEEAVHIYQEGGTEELANWMQTYEEDGGRLSIYFLNEEGDDILGREVPESLSSRADTITGSPFYPREFRPIIPGRDGKTYSAFFGPNVIELDEVFILRDRRLLYVLGALALGSYICFLLTRSLVQRLNRLTSTAKSLGEGHLDERVGLHDRDEIGRLSNQFDRMADRIEELVNSRQKMFRNISHEMRTPLTRVQLALDLMQEPNRKALDYTGRIQAQLSHLGHLLDQILNLARLEDPESNYVFQPLDVLEVVEEVLEDARFEAETQGKGLEISIDCEEQFVRGDTDMLGSAIENIIRNAIRFTPEGTSVKVSIYKPTEAEVCVEVSDKGPGVPEDQLRYIFEPFHRGSTTDAVGSGIGLSISKHVAIKLDGSIEAENLEPSGLKVSIKLPTA